MAPLSAPSDFRLSSSEGARKTSDRVGRSSFIGTAAIFALYVVISLAANRTAWSHGITHSIQTSGGADVQEEVWFLGQFPWALIHGINPFGNSWLNFPFGVNLMDNGSMPLLGLIGAPVTLLFGPMATFNVLLNLGYGLSAMAFFVMARRFVTWAPAAFIGGVLYGFSPFAVAEGHGHLFLIFDPVPPLVVLVVDRTLRTKETSVRNGSILLGLCLIAQFYISTELFAGLAVMMGLTLVVVVCYVMWRRVRFDFHRLARLAVSAIFVSGLGIGFGVWMALLGPHHIVGPAQTRVALAGISNDPLGWVVPTIDQHFTAGYANVGDSLVAQRDANWHVIIDNAAENGSYIGVSLLALLVVGAIWLRRRALSKNLRRHGGSGDAAVAGFQTAHRRQADRDSVALHCYCSPTTSAEQRRIPICLVLLVVRGVATRRCPGRAT